MLGMSQGLINEVGGVVQGWLKNPLNRSFFYWFFLPAAGFLMLQSMVVGTLPGFAPAATQTAGASAAPAEDMTILILGILAQNIIGLILIPMILAVLLSALSGTVLRLFQGSLPGIRWLLSPLTARNRKHNAEIYQTLRQERDEYLLLVSNGLKKVVVGEETKVAVVSGDELKAAIAELSSRIQAHHVRIEKKYPTNILPVMVERVGATALGNVLANTQEYPFERYGIDAQVFWSRLRAEIEPEKLEPLDANYAAMSGLLNIALLSALFAMEELVLGVWSLLTGAASWQPWLAFLTSVLICAGSYRAAVSVAGALGNAFRLCFDYYRVRVLKKFGLKHPEKIDDERKLWLKLAAFLRRGESFYFPSEWRAPEEIKKPA
jgi:hypothetical protein